MPMKVGVMLPTFTERAEPAIEAARRAEAAGLHGVFAYNHIWPLGQPARPALWPFPVLGAVAVTTSRITIGTLVARVGITPADVLVGELATLDELTGGRFVAGVGTGEVVGDLAAIGLTTWVGGGGAATHALARRAGATVNLWNATPTQIAAEGVHGPVSWGGRFPAPADDPGSAPGARGAARAVESAAALIDALVAAGATWAVFTWPGSLDPLVLAARHAGVLLDPAPPNAA
jgi:alkanesulfonate monooxygenase SsuD/methylene tetrahydromethanopterin reductase-like flavin-dependent oxidoreductase (luciferase family)